jgi:CSLREA domain-containing protein
MCALLLFCGAKATQAATFTVNQSGDAGDGVCDATCTLRDAVTAANGAASDDTITFNSGLTNITLTGGEIVIASNGTLTISGPGANVLTIDGGAGTNRIFSINGSTTVTITGVTLTGGGGTGASDTGRGGALYGAGVTLTLDGVNLTGNSADFYGGGLYIIGGLRIRNSTISTNTATQFSGGGIYAIFASVSISNSTVSDNAAGQFGGGGHFEQSSATLRNVTATANTASTGGGFDGIGGGSINLGNTIVAGNTATNRNELSSQSGTTLTSAGNNLIGDSPGDAADTNSAITYQSTDILDTPPVLGPLQNNGGPTPTRALLTFSRAIDRGDNAKAVDPFDNSALTTDQRGAGFPRAVDGNGDGIATVDIGAYEVQSPTAAASSISGRVTDTVGHPIGGVLITLGGAATNRTITNSEGFYRFNNLQTDGFYSITPSLANYSFNPGTRSFSLLADQTDAIFTAAPNAVPSANPLDTPEYFVRQQYLDFLVREPDEGGFAYWAAQLTQCGTDGLCLRSKRLDVSNAFFYELEYQQTGSYVYRLYRVAYGNNQPFPNPGPDSQPSDPIKAAHLPSYAVFSADRARVVGGTSLAQSQLDLANQFVARPEFLNKYPSSLATGAQFVDAVLQTIQNYVGVNLASQRDALINLYNQGGRGSVMYRLADDNAQTNPINNRALIDAEYNRAFALTQYFGYLKRDPDLGGLNFWFGQVNRFPVRNVGIQHAMVCSFITSAEYQLRFGPVVTHSNQECPQ